MRSNNTGLDYKMSYKLSSVAYKQININSSEQSVLSLLAFRANDNAECWPSIKSISADTKLDRKIVITSLLSLSKKNLIVKTGIMKGRTKRVPVYKLLLLD